MYPPRLLHGLHGTTSIDLKAVNDYDGDVRPVYAYPGQKLEPLPPLELDVSFMTVLILLLQAATASSPFGKYPPYTPCL